MIQNFKNLAIIQKMNFMIKVVITAAGKGTRLLPFTKEIPKEMILWVKNLSKIKILNDISIRVIDKKK